MPTFAHADWIGGSVASVLGQAFRDFELIVIDDGSTDGTSELLAGIRDPRLRVLRQERRGINAALNAGLAAARGELVARNDSDDEWLPHLLERLVPALVARPEMGFVYGRSEGVDAGGRALPELRGYPMRYPDQPLRSLLRVDCSSAIATLIRRRCLERIGGWGTDEGLYGDWEMVLRAAALCGGFFLDERVARFRIHDRNSTRYDRLSEAELAQLLETRRQVLERIFAAPELAAAAAPYRAEAWRNLHIGEGNVWLGCGRLRRALAAFGHALASGRSRPETVARIAWAVAAWHGLSRVPGGTRGAHRLLTWLRREGRLG